MENEILAKALETDTVLVLQTDAHLRAQRLNFREFVGDKVTSAPPENVNVSEFIQSGGQTIQQATTTTGQEFMHLMNNSLSDTNKSVSFGHK